MDDKGANIDLLFRNGLKDYEVLPPSEVWTSIRPAIRKKQTPFVLLRAAALVATVLSLSFLAYRWSMEITSGPGNPVVALNEESVAPAGGPAIFRQQVQQNKVENDNPLFAADASDVIPPVIVVRDESTISASEEITFPSLSAGVFPDGISRGRTDLMEVSYPGINNLLTEEYTMVLVPSTGPADKQERWTIAALVAPTYFTRFTGSHNELSRQIMDSEQPLFSYSGGVALSYKINRRVSIQSGIYFSSVGQMVEGITAFSGFQKYDNTKGDHNFEVLTANGTVYTSNTDVFLLNHGLEGRMVTKFTNDVFDPVKAELRYIDNSLRQSFSYLELPFIVRYKLIDKTLGLNVIGGLSSNLLVNNSVYTNIDGGKYLIGKTEGVNSITFSSSLGMGMEYNFTKSLSLNLEPTFRYYLNPFNELSGLKFHPYSFGIFSGLSFKF